MLFAFIAVTSAMAGSWIALAITLVVIAIVGAAMTIFSRFTVEVTDTEARAWFGWGWPRRIVQLSDVVAARTVRNRWWYGLGIRWFPGGTLWNVWGLDAVEFDLGDARTLRFGTDEPDALEAAIAARIS